MDRALNFDMFSHDENEVCDGDISFDIKALLLKYGAEGVLNDLLGHKNPEIAEKALEIQQEYIEVTEEHEIRNAIEMAQTNNGHLFDDRKEFYSNFEIWIIKMFKN